jgi:hypothetical protein
LSLRFCASQTSITVCNYFSLLIIYTFKYYYLILNCFYFNDINIIYTILFLFSFYVKHSFFFIFFLEMKNANKNTYTSLNESLPLFNLSWLTTSSKWQQNYSTQTQNSHSQHILNSKQYDEQQRRFYYNIEKKLSIIPILLMIAGTLGNMIAFYVLTRKKLRRQSTMLFFASLTIMDTLSLYQVL